MGSKEVESVEKTKLIDMNLEDIFKLDLDATPSSLLVGTEENPVQFEWGYEVKYILDSQY